MHDFKWIIDVHELSKTFDKRSAVTNLDLQIGAGEIFGFLGPNGAGKTTSLRMLCGLITPDSGFGQCVGYDILTKSRDIKMHVGYMSQYFGLYKDLTVYENMVFFADIYGLIDKKGKIEQYLYQLDLGNKKDQVAGTLSGGWKQRLSLAVALLHDPLLLLLDEPTASIDPKSRREFWELMHQLAGEGITILLSSHDMDEVLKCDRIAYMSDGRTMMSGTIEHIIETVDLATCAIQGTNLLMLSKQLQASPGIDQVLLFRDSLHVSSKNEGQLLDALKPFLDQKNYIGKKIQSTLEDVFVWLSSNPEEGSLSDKS
jgi:ABC-2 type transport system ATP-binding protein